MVIFFAKVLFSAIVISFASWLSLKKPVLAGFIIALPLLSILSIAFSYAEHKDLDKTINKLLNHNFFKIHSSFWNLLFISLLRGLASGLGWVLGATILVSLLTYTLSQIEFIPILGDWVSRLIAEIEAFDR